MGRAFSEARGLADEVGGRLFILSAGLGFISEDAIVPSYSLTVSKTSEDSIQARCNDGSFSPEMWWKLLNLEFGAQYPIRKLISANPRGLWLFALSKSYLELVVSDLDQLSDRQLERVRIVGPQVNRGTHRILDACLLEVDSRLNGPDSPIVGTQGDFAQRAARYAYEEVIKGNPGGDIKAHRRAMSRRVSGWRLPKKYKRQPMSDESIMRKISSLWKAAEGRSGRMLRLLRDQEQIACEQGRFKSLFKQVQMSVIS